MATRKTGKATKAAKAAGAGPAGGGRKTAARQRDIQEQALRSAKQAKKKAPAKKSPAQAGARRQPTTLPAQHLPKPGMEGDLDLQPRFKAPDYAGSGKLGDRHRRRFGHRPRGGGAVRARRRRRRRAAPRGGR